MDNMIALNNQANGLKFTSMIISSRTRRAMRNELIIPDSAVEMTYSDMCEVNGGGISVSAMAMTLDITIAIVSLVIAAVSAFQAIHTIGQISGGLIRNMLTKSATSALKGMISAAKTAFAITISAAVFGFIDTLANVLFNFSVGYLVATIIDFSDGNRNGICFG